MLSGWFTHHRGCPTFTTVKPLHWGDRKRKVLIDRQSDMVKYTEKQMGLFWFFWLSRRKKGISGEARKRSEVRKREQESTGYLKAFIQPWAGLDGCKEVLTLDRTELEGSCRRWIQQLLHRQSHSQLKHAFFFVWFNSTVEVIKGSYCCFPLTGEIIHIHASDQFTAHFLSSCSHMPSDKFRFFSTHRPYRAIILSYNKLQSRIPIGRAGCSTFTFSTWHEHTSCFHLSLLHSALHTAVELESSRNETVITIETKLDIFHNGSPFTMDSYTAVWRNNCDWKTIQPLKEGTG